MAEPTLESYVQAIVEDSRLLTNYLTENDYYLPSFSPGGFKDYPDSLPTELLDIKRRLASAAQAVSDLANGPRSYLDSLSRSYIPPTILRYLLHFSIPQAIPLHGSIPYSRIAEECSIEDEKILRRILRAAITNFHLFLEPTPEEVAHTPFSAALATDPGLRAKVMGRCEREFGSCAKLVEAVERGSKWTGWGVVNKGEGEEEGRDGEGYADGWFDDQAKAGFELRHVVEGYAWKGLKKVVEIGGSMGGLGVALARANLDLEVLVEDFPGAFAGMGEEEERGQFLPEDVEGRVRFVGHDFRGKQPEEIAGAEVYLMRNVLREYSDKEATKILKNLVEFLKDGAKLLVVEAIVKAPGSSAPWFEREVRSSDIELMAMLGSKERQWDEWECLFKGVDSDLRVLSISQPLQSALSLIEVGYSDKVSVGDV